MLSIGIENAAVPSSLRKRVTILRKSLLTWKWLLSKQQLRIERLSWVTVKECEIFSTPI
jgi:hypothetical protein